MVSPWDRPSNRLPASDRLERHNAPSRALDLVYCHGLVFGMVGGVSLFVENRTDQHRDICRNRWGLGIERLLGENLPVNGWAPAAATAGDRTLRHGLAQCNALRCDQPIDRHALQAV